MPLIGDIHCLQLSGKHQDKMFAWAALEHYIGTFPDFPDLEIVLDEFERGSVQITEQGNPAEIQFFFAL
ncbi:hypothetical protein M622_17800 [Thauera terpenica 58Eu]|uniref:Uncharacterized protein n=1 Tax=Thauera terpenica 58Eu TaxID=1348657 RepID=T0AVT4_9RHOO|nr:hypothetical protein M622_17800 [Thauera terpenica 58Eu]